MTFARNSNDHSSFITRLEPWVDCRTLQRGPHQLATQDQGKILLRLPLTSL